jgi:hypothetical protein
VARAAARVAVAQVAVVHRPARAILVVDADHRRAATNAADAAAVQAVA